MRILIVHQNSDLAAFWAKYLSRQNADVTVETTADAAIKTLRFDEIHALILDMALANGGSFQISDHASLFHPEIPIIAISDSTFFSGSELYQMMPNTRALLSMPVQLADLRAIVEFYGRQLDEGRGDLRAVR